MTWLCEGWKPFNLSLPVHLVAPFLYYKAFVGSLHSNFWHIASWYTAIVFPPLISAGYVFTWVNKERTGIKHLRGRQLFRGKQARIAAIEALGSLRSDRASELLITQLDDRNPRIRAAAAESLGHLGDPRALEPLRKRLSDRDAWAQASAATALRALGQRV